MMSYSNGLLPNDYYHETIERGKDGRDGVGFHLTDDGNYDMQNKKLTNVGEGTLNQVNKHQLTAAMRSKVDKSNAPFLKLDGSNFMGASLNMNEEFIEYVKSPALDHHAANKGWIEGKLQDSLKHDGQTGLPYNLNANNNKIINLKDNDPSNSNDQDVPNIKYLKNNYLNRFHSILQGDLNMNKFNTSNLALPSRLEDGVNKQYVDENLLDVSGTNTMTASINLSNNKINNLGDPSSAQDAVNRRHLDNQLNNLADDLKKHVMVTPPHPIENTFRYLMSTIDEISTEYGCLVEKIEKVTCHVNFCLLKTN